ncbi:hypothetical protein AYK26_00100 [Euryarchaeota archaeon SM23-78]|nr:MAG: hypothetical protein AYK26_00100 [Euryarchaeota archaeon SM23-78]MBW3000521.1 hypothetical protein [Candidatus Woesearchaeota archaeon]
MNKRGAYFFVIDALIAGSVIFLSLILIFTTHTMVPDPTPTLRMVEDYTDFLITTKVREFQGPYVKSLTEDRNITNLDNTLLEQLTEFYYYNESGIKDTSIIMNNYIQEISQGIIPDHRNFAISMNNTLLYSRVNRPIGDSKLVLSSRKISFKRINETFIYGPVVAEVKIWI